MRINLNNFLVINWRLLLITLMLNGCATNIDSVEDLDIGPEEPINLAVFTPFGSKEKKLAHIGRSLRDAAILAKQDLGDLNLNLTIVIILLKFILISFFNNFHLWYWYN